MLNGGIAFRDDIENYNGLGKIALLAHESLHLYQGLKMQGDDETHDLWNENLSKMQEILQEYSDDNILGLSKDEIYELSIFNIGPGGTEFDSHINKMVTKNGTTYDDELSLFYHRINTLIDDEYKENTTIEIEIKLETPQSTEKSDEK